ncbi:MAG: 4,5-DOPA dioxygenase extradiol [Synechococcaceae cyanobacterium SM2_3_2]|nr:4,5-DOPA dioxygenase extradiol [Synechococcaceae cyanobacterium SM2_3_2]
MPAIFFGHGNPMNALADNAYSKAWAQIGQSIPRPRAILAISAHWYIPATAVTNTTAPPTIHDFGGFPPELFQVEYPAPGSLELAHRVKHLLDPVVVKLDDSWGLDHGTWSVLCHIFPQANIPVVQLSIDRTQPPVFHYQLAQRLVSLRAEGILIMGSGNVVHNLRAYAWGQPTVPPLDWATRFEQQVREAVLSADMDPLIEFERLGQDAALSVPTPEHYLPLLYVMAQRQAGDPVSFPVEGMEGGSISMLSVQVGA